MRVLGVSPSHDGSVAIINDGEIEYFCKEERLSRIKHDSSPYKTLSYVARNISGDIDAAVIGSPTWYNQANDTLEIFLKKTFDCEVTRMCGQRHLTHASLAFNNSGFTESLVVVIDRQGSDVNGRMREAETVFKVDQEYNFEPIYKSFWLYNIGEKFDFSNYNDVLRVKMSLPNCEIIAESNLGITKVYETATTLIGEHSLENGKTMGLSAYGTKERCHDLFVNGVPNNNLFMHIDDNDVQPILKGHFLLKMGNRSPLPQNGYEVYADYAYQVQKQTQREVLNLVSRKVDETGIKNVCLTGGYGFNVVANEHLVKNLPNVNFFFEPLADDSGNSIGAALQVYRLKTKDTKLRPLKDTFFNHVQHDIPDVGKKVSTKEIAELLDKGKIVAVYNGKAEARPRSLGNRSILFDARNPDAKKIINSVKHREWYRPFAASVLKKRANEYFDMHGLKDSPFMTISFSVRKEKLNIIPGVVHKDDSCRIQTVDSSIRHYYKLLKEFDLLTGVPVLLNTSFNTAGNPLVETVEEAINMFEKTEIDILWFPENKRMLMKTDKTKWH